MNKPQRTWPSVIKNGGDFECCIDLVETRDSIGLSLLCSVFSRINCIQHCDRTVNDHESRRIGIKTLCLFAWLPVHRK